MATRSFGEVIGANEGTFLVRIAEGGEQPPIGSHVQILSGALAARGAFATDDHNALVDARESMCAALRAQVQRTNTFERQRDMIHILKLIDQLFEVA